MPRRKCDDCGKLYQPKQPFRAGQKFGFCSPEHKKEFHKHGGSYGKLKPYIAAEIKKRIKELSPADATRIENLEKRLEWCERMLGGVRAAYLLDYFKDEPRR